MVFDGRPVRYYVPRPAVKDGIVYVTEDRKAEGFFETMSIAENLYSGLLASGHNHALRISMAEMRALSADWSQRLNIRAINDNARVVELSGGNQQKVVIGKWLATEPEILILDEPTAGIDIGSKSEIIRLVRDLAQAGKGVIVISSELSELLTACDRILVMADGRAHQMLDRADLDDPSETNPEHALQAAERRLQIEIQKALTIKEASHG